MSKVPRQKLVNGEGREHAANRQLEAEEYGRMQPSMTLIHFATAGGELLEGLGGIYTLRSQVFMAIPSHRRLSS